MDQPIDGDAGSPLIAGRRAAYPEGRGHAGNANQAANRTAQPTVTSGIQRGPRGRDSNAKALPSRALRHLDELHDDGSIRVRTLGWRCPCPWRRGARRRGLPRNAGTVGRAPVQPITGADGRRSTVPAEWRISTPETKPATVLNA
jgi:hypothetical protein